MSSNQQHSGPASEAYHSSTDSSTIYSMPLSEAETFTHKRERDQLLSGTYQNSFAYFAPYQAQAQSQRRAGARAAYDFERKSDDNYDEEKTMVSPDEIATVMQRPISSYGRLQQLFIVSKLLQNTIYVFADKTAFITFKQQKKAKTQIVNFIETPAHSSNSDETISTDSGEHSDPFNSRISSISKPLLEISVPYLSSLRPNTPFMVFRRQREYKTNNGIDDEKYDFCIVRRKSLEFCKRYVFHFQLENSPAFSVLAFQNDYRPFTDFNYKDTRFRVFGTSRKMYLSYYNPELKLCILDHDQPSLADNLVEKRTRNRNLSFNGGENVENLSPSVDNPVIQQIITDDGSYIGRNSVPRDMPPFGKFLDSCAYTKKKLRIPEKFSEAGKIAVYHETSESTSVESSLTHSVDLDSLVITTILLALRETNLRSTVKGDELRGVSTSSALS